MTSLDLNKQNSEGKGASNRQAAACRDAMTDECGASSLAYDSSSPLARQREQDLWNIYWRDPQAEKPHMELVEFYLPLVARMANKMPISVRQNVSREELVSSGVLGLHEAITNFSKDEGAQFSTFAYKRIRGSMMDELRSQDHLTRTQRGCYRSICEAIARLTQKLSRPPTDEEIALETNLSIGEIDRYIGMGSETVNLNDEFGEGLSYMDVIADDQTPSPLDVTHQLMAMDKLFKEHFRQLDEREQKMLYLRYFEEMSVKEIAKVFEITEGRVSQLFNKIIIKLRALMLSNQETEDG